MAQKPALTLTPRRSADPEPDLTSLLVIHRAIREDLARLATMLDQVDARSTTAARRRALRRYAASLLTEIRLHHAAEDDVVWPVIQATAGQAIDLTPLTDDHHGLEAVVARVELALPALAGPSAETGRLTELRAAVRELRDMLDEHIADEETQIVPVIRQYVPAESYAWCERRIMRMPSISILRFSAPWVARFAGPGELARLLAAADWTMRPFLAVTRPGYRRLERRAFVEMDGQKTNAERIRDRDAPPGCIASEPGRAPMTATSEPGTAIWTRGLTKRYARLTAVDGLDLEIPSGVVAGFVGPNGAGKTTTLRMLLGLVRPTAGDGAVLGAPLSAPARYLGRVGVLIESPAFFPGLSGERNLAVQATLAGIDMARIQAVLDRVGLASRGKDRYKTYSFGMKQRLAIAAGLLGQPCLLILDEPANGLDPAGIKDMRDLLGTLRAEGITVFVSSHQLGEVEQICDWLVVIDQGQMLFQGPTRQLMTHGGDRLRIRCQHAADLPRLASLLARAGLTATRTGDQLWVDLAAADDRDETVAEVSRIAMVGKLALTELTVTKASLEDRYLTLIGEGHQS